MSEAPAAAAAAAASAAADGGRFSKPILAFKILPPEVDPEESLCLTSELEAFLTELGDELVAPVAIAGPFRLGKSYLANRLLDKDDGFELGHEIVGKTKGIWQWTQRRRLPNGATLIVMDTEGVFEPTNTRRRDTKILAMAVLASSRFVLNLSQRVDSAVLDAIHLVTSLIQQMIRNMKVDQAEVKAASVKPGDEKQAENLAKMSRLRQFFPDLLWLIRDAYLELPPGFADLTDYIKRDLLAKREEVSDFDDPDVRARTSERNSTRAMIASGFRSHVGRSLPRPGTEEAIRKLGQSRHHATREFNDQMDALVDWIRNNTDPKCLSDGVHETPMTASVYLTFLRELVKEINKPGAVPSMPDTYRAVLEQEMGRAFRDSVQAYRRVMDAVALPTGEETITAAHAAAEAAAQARLRQCPLREPQLLHDKSVALHKHLGEEDLSNTVEARGRPTEASRAFCAGLVLEYLKKNHELSRQHCGGLVQRILADAQLEQRVQTSGPLSATGFREWTEWTAAYDAALAEYDRQTSGHVAAEAAAEYRLALRHRLGELQDVVTQTLQVKPAVRALAEQKQRNAALEQEKKLAEEEKRKTEQALLRMQESHKEQQEALEKRLREQMDEARKQSADMLALMQKQHADALAHGDQKLAALLEANQKTLDAQLQAQREATDKLISEMQRQHKEFMEKLPRDTCIASSSLVRCADGRLRRCAELRVGDRVASVDGRGRIVYSPVYYNAPLPGGVEFVCLCAASPDGSRTRELRVTPDHLVYSDAGAVTADAPLRFAAPRPARTVRAGDWLWVSDDGSDGSGGAAPVRRWRVQSAVTRVLSDAPHNLLVLNNCVLADGVLASCHAVHHLWDVLDALPLRALYYVWPALLEKHWLQRAVRAYDDVVAPVAARAVDVARRMWRMAGAAGHLW